MVVGENGKKNFWEESLQFAKGILKQVPEAKYELLSDIVDPEKKRSEYEERIDLDGLYSENARFKRINVPVGLMELIDETYQKMPESLREQLTGKDSLNDTDGLGLGAVTRRCNNNKNVCEVFVREAIFTKDSETRTYQELLDSFKDYGKTDKTLKAEKMRLGPLETRELIDEAFKRAYHVVRMPNGALLAEIELDPKKRVNYPENRGPKLPNWKDPEEVPSFVGMLERAGIAPENKHVSMLHSSKKYSAYHASCNRQGTPYQLRQLKFELKTKNADYAKRLPACDQCPGTCGTGGK